MSGRPRSANKSRSSSPSADVAMPDAAPMPPPSQMVGKLAQMVERDVQSDLRTRTISFPVGVQRPPTQVDAKVNSARYASPRFSSRRSARVINEQCVPDGPAASSRSCGCHSSHMRVASILAPHERISGGSGMRRGTQAARSTGASRRRQHARHAAGLPRPRSAAERQSCEISPRRRQAQRGCTCHSAWATRSPRR